MSHLVMEGPDGVGKSTVAKRLVDQLREEGHNAVCYPNPGGTALGQEIRKLVKYREDIEIDRHTEQILMSADLCCYLNTVVNPALDKGKVVISDRISLISGIVFSLAGGLDVARIKALQNLVLTTDLRPLRVILLMTDYEILEQHRENDLERKECKFESRGEDYSMKVWRYYDQLSRRTGEAYSLIAPLCNQGLLSLHPVVADVSLSEVAERVISKVRLVL